MNIDLPLGYIASNGVVLCPDDSLERAVELLQEADSGAVPVMEGGYLRGLVSDREVARGLTTNPDAPVSAVMTTAVPVASSSMSAHEGLRLLAETDFPALPVALPDGRFVGTVGRSDLLAALYRRRRPASVGGMATPLGVYLSDGTVRGGVGDGALMLTGLYLFIGSMVSGALSIGAATVWHAASLDRYVPASNVTPVVFLIAFALWFRLSWVAGYHAAEHQTVHAIERNEPLTVERVARMPRPHPRCGTNLMVLFYLFAALVAILHVDDVLAGAFSLVAYRFFGHWVQLHVTTRPASRRQLEAGIRAGEEVLERYQNGAPPRRFPGLNRLWNMGLAQVALGSMLPMLILIRLAPYVPFVGRLLRYLQ
ncbi:MAG TPA: DUF1385 domain-containing protein [Armatimonadota bacterium]